MFIDRLFLGCWLIILFKVKLCWSNIGLEIVGYRVYENFKYRMVLVILFY